MLLTRRFKACSQSFALIKNTLEGYDNLAIMTILKGSAGFFELKFDSSMEKEVADVIEGIRLETDLVDL